MTETKHIAVLGTGAIGRSLGQQWHEAGHKVTFGSRNPASVAHQLKATDGRLEVTDIQTAAATADVVVLAVPHDALLEVADAIRLAVAGKVVIDCTNAVVFTPDGRLASGLVTSETEGRYTAKLFPDSRIVRTFSHIQDELLDSRGRRQPGIWAAAVAGDDSVAKDLACALVRDIGFVAVDIGTLDESAPLDPGGILFPNMFTPADMKRQVADKAPKRTRTSYQGW